MADNAVNITLRAKLEQFSKDLDNAARKLAKTGKKFESIGKNMSVAFTLPLVAGAYKSVQAYGEEEKALNSLSAAMEANGKDVAKLLPEYEQFASEIQKITTVGDETTLSLLQLAETMGSASPKEAAKNAISLSKALGIDLQTATKMAVLAQSGQYTMLQRYVPALRAAKTETEKAAVVQKLFANGWNIATAEVNTFSGSMIQMKNALGDAMEKIGAKLAPMLTKLSVRIKSMAENFNGLNDGTVRLILLIGGLVAAMGPLFFIIGKVTLGISSLMTGTALLLNPIFLLVTAITAVVGAFVALGVIISKNTKMIAINWEILWTKIELGFQKMFLNIKTGIGKLFKLLGIDISDNIDKLQQKIAANEIKLRQAIFKKIQLENAINESKKESTTTTEDYTESIDEEAEALKREIDELVKANNLIEKNNKLKDIAPGVSAKDFEKQNQGEVWVYSGTEGKTGLLDNLNKSLTNIEPRLSRFQKAFSSFSKKIKVDVDILYNALAGVLTDAFNAMGNAIEQAITSNGQYTFQNFLDSLLKVVYDFMKAFGAQLTAIGVGNLALGNPAGAWQIAAGAALIAGGAAAAGLHQNAMAKREPSYNNGTQNLQLSLESTLQGRDLYLSNQRETNYRGRIR